MDSIRIGLLQAFCTADVQENLERTVFGIREAAGLGARVVCLQELFRSRYFCQVEDVACFDLAESIPGPTTDRLGQLAKELGICLIVPLFEKRAPGIYHNTAVVIERSGSILGSYRKMHIPDDPLYYEKFYFTPGDLGFLSHHTSAGEVGILICWDQWFPEAARLTALSGAQILFYPTAIGWMEGENDETKRAQHDAWETIQRGHAIANGVYVAAANRVGNESSLRFWGQSFVSDPFGRVLARASAAEEEVLVVDCNLKLIEETRRHWPFYRDRRVDAYSGLNLRFRE